MASQPEGSIPSCSAARFRPTILTNDDKDDRSPLTRGRECLKKWLGRKIRVVLHNKLILIGIFSCTDHDENLVLSHCGTYVSEDEKPISVGKVMVPGHQIATVSVDMPVEEVKLLNKIDEIV